MGPGMGACGRLRPGGRGRAQAVEARRWVPGGPGPVLELPTRQELLAQRVAAKAAKDWAQADALRARIAAAGWKIVDTAQGARLEKA
jgi:cysteinyl-tRNA synthetase